MATSSEALATSRMRYHISRLQTRPQLAAVLDCLFDIVPKRTEPALDALALIDDKLVFARARGDSEYLHFVGRTDELASDLLGLVRHLKLGADERAYILRQLGTITSRA